MEARVPLGQVAEPVKTTITKILGIRELAQHLKTMDQGEEESKTSQDLLDSKQTQNSSKTTQLIMSSPPAAAGGT